MEEGVLHLERLLLSGELGPLFQAIPQPYVDASPLLRKARGEAHLLSGKLLEAKAHLSSALKSFAVQTFEEHVLSALVWLTKANLRLGELAEARVSLQFLKEEFLHRQGGISGEIPALLAVSAHVMGEASERQAYFDQAIACFLGNDEKAKLIWSLFELLAESYEDTAFTAWEKYYGAFGQLAETAVYGRGSHPYSGWLQYLTALQAIRHQQWHAAYPIWQDLKPEELYYPYRCMAEILRIETGLHANRNDVHPLPQIEALEQTLSESDPDTGIQYRLNLLRVHYHTQNQETEKAEAYVAKSRTWAQFGVFPTVREAGQEIAAASAAESATGWRIQFFGGMKWIRGNRVIEQINWKRKKSRELFLYLLLQPGYAAQRDQVIETMFQSPNVEASSNHFYVAVHQLKKILRQYWNGETGIVLESGTVRIPEELIDSVDVEQYLALIRVGNQLWLTDRELSLELYERACQMYEEPVPQMLYIDWLDRFKEYLLEEQAKLLAALGQEAEKSADAESAEYYYREWIRLRPLQEEACRALHKLLVNQNRRDEAESLYAKLAKRCQEELGVVPEPFL